MDSGEDFTFAQVLPPVDSAEVYRVADCVSGIRVDAGDENGSSHENFGVVQKEGTTSAQQASVGSLMFTVIDASSQKVDQRSKHKKTITTENSDAASGGMVPVRKPRARVKVPFEKGYSQMDWLKLTRTHPDLAGLKGQSSKRLISLSEVKQHQSDGHMWTVLKGRVYNIAPYMKFHPGGADMLMKAVGKDCTSLFNKYHAWVNADFLLEKCLIGILDDGLSPV